MPSTIGRLFPLACVALALWTGRLFAQEVSLATLKERFAEQRSLLEKPIADLNQLYEVQLTALREKVKSAGDLEKILIVDKEIKGFHSGETAGEDTFPEIERLRTIYGAELKKRRGEIATALPPFLSRYLEQLDALSKELTRQDRLEEALAVREETKSIQQLLTEASAGLAGAPTAPAAVMDRASGRLTALGFGKMPTPLGDSGSRIRDAVSIKYWERSTFSAGWVTLRANGSVATDENDRVSKPGDNIIAVDCSAAGILMVRDNGTLDTSLCQFQPPAERVAEFTGIVDVTLGHAESPGQESAVALKSDGSLLWWGPATENVQGPPSDARNAIASVVSGRGVFTAIKKNGELVSWKFTAGSDGSVKLPEEAARGRFSQLAMSEQHTIALKTNGEVLCWGNNSEGQTNVPADLGKCTEVRVLHNVLSLARKEDGTWATWGRTFGDMQKRLNGASKMTQVVGRLFPPGDYAYAIWIESEQ